MAKTIIIFLISLLLLISIFPLISAQEIATQEDIKIAGITPDSTFLWGLDRAIERVTEIFSEKAKLKHVKERLAEVKVMIQENNIEAAEKGRQSFNRLILRIKNRTQVQEHIQLMDNLGQEISDIASVKGGLTEEQRSEIKKLILQHSEKVRKEISAMVEERRELG